jgi:hypothetical protein
MNSVSIKETQWFKLMTSMIAIIVYGYQQLNPAIKNSSIFRMIIGVILQSPQR